MISVQTTARTESGMLRVLSARQLRQLQKAPDGRSRKGRRDQAILGCLAHGLRVGEVARLKVENVLPDGNRLRLRFAGGKTGRVRTVTITPAAARRLRRWLDETSPRLYVFAHQRGEHISVRTIQRLVRRYGAKVGAPDLHPHALRHTAATILVHATNDLWKTAGFLGHSVNTCSRYYAGYMTRDSDQCAEALAAAR